MNATQTEMTLRDYGNVVLRRKWIVIAATLIATVLAVVLSAAQTPVYSSSAQVLVQSRGQDGRSDDRQANSTQMQPDLVCPSGFWHHRE